MQANPVISVSVLSCSCCASCVRFVTRWFVACTPHQDYDLPTRSAPQPRVPSMRSQMAAHMGVWQAPQLITIRHARYYNRRCRQYPLPRIQRDKWIIRANPREYVGSDGRRKSTIEEAFTVTDGGSDKTSSLDGRPPPWGIGWQTAEADLAWNDDVKKRLIKVPRRVAAHTQIQC